MEVGCAVFAEIFGCWGSRVGVPDFDEDSRVVARQPQAQGRLVVVACHGLHGVDYELGDQEFGVRSGFVQAPLPEQVPDVEAAQGTAVGRAPSSR